MSCADLIGHLFLARDVTHSVHLNTRSYAKHKALGGFYEDVIELADEDRKSTRLNSSHT